MHTARPINADPLRHGRMDRVDGAETVQDRPPSMRDHAPISSRDPRAVIDAWLAGDDLGAQS